MDALAVIIVIVVIVFFVVRLIWYAKVAEMMKTLAEAKGFKGNTDIFRDAIIWTGTLGALTVLALPDKNTQKELEYLREEVKSLREEIKNR